MRTITVAVKKPGESWKSKRIEDTLESCQQIVGGYIENFMTTASGIELFCNEEGKIFDLEPNVISPMGDVIVGPIFAVRSDDDGEFQSLTVEDLEKLGIK